MWVPIIDKINNERVINIVYKPFEVPTTKRNCILGQVVKNFGVN